MRIMNLIQILLDLCTVWLSFYLGVGQSDHLESAAVNKGGGGLTQQFIEVMKKR